MTRQLGAQCQSASDWVLAFALIIGFTSFGVAFFKRRDHFRRHFRSRRTELELLHMDAAQPVRAPIIDFQRQTRTPKQSQSMGTVLRDGTSGDGFYVHRAITPADPSKRSLSGVLSRRGRQRISDTINQSRTRSGNVYNTFPTLRR